MSSSRTARAPLSRQSTRLSRACGSTSKHRYRSSIIRRLPFLVTQHHHIRSSPSRAARCSCQTFGPTIRYACRILALPLRTRAPPSGTTRTCPCFTNSPRWAVHFLALMLCSNRSISPHVVELLQKALASVDNPTIEHITRIARNLNLSEAQVYNFVNRNRSKKRRYSTSDIVRPRRIESLGAASNSDEGSDGGVKSEGAAATLVHYMRFCHLACVLWHRGNTRVISPKPEFYLFLFSRECFFTLFLSCDVIQ